MKAPIHLQKFQQGATLVISLVILTLLMIVTLTNMRGTLMQEKMTAAVSDSNLALAAAESAIRDAEKYLDTLNSTNAFIGNDTKGLYNLGQAPSPFKFDYDDANGPWKNQLPVSTLANVAQQPKFYIEMVGEVNNTGASFEMPMICGYDCEHTSSTMIGFKIYALGFGRSEFARRVVSSFYAKQF